MCIVMLQPGMQPGECWAFSGSEGYLVIQLTYAIKVSEVSLEHIPVSLSPTGNISSAPRDFTVWVSRFLLPPEACCFCYSKVGIVEYHVAPAVLQ